MTQEQLAEITDVASNSISRIERGLLMPALPTLIDICNALGTGADAILSAYVTVDTPIRWTPLAPIKSWQPPPRYKAGQPHSQ